MALVLLTKTLGYMPGAYTGPYPTQEEAEVYLKNAMTISAASLRDDVIFLNNSPVELASGVGFRLSLVENTGHDEQQIAARAIEIPGGCVILELLSPASQHIPVPDVGVIALIERANGRQIAIYDVYREVSR